VLGVSSFDLAKDGDDYIVRAMGTKPARGIQFENSFLKRIAEIVWGSADADASSLDRGVVSEPIRYTPADISWLDIQGASRRGKANAMPDAQKLSQVLRVVGDHLQRKKAREFTVSMSGQSVSTFYQTSGSPEQRENFTVDNLYDLGVHMYQRRSNRRPAG
jgi:hypothetical protein